MNTIKRSKAIHYSPFVFLLGGLFPALAGFAAYSYTNQAPQPAESPEPLPVHVFGAQAETGYAVHREFVGRVEARRESQVGFEVGGLVQSIRVNEGDRVQQGQLLAELDTQLLQARRLELVALRNQAKAALQLAQGTRSRVAAANRLDAVSSQQMDEADRDFAAKMAAFEQARAALRHIDVRLQKSRLTAPFPALIAERFLDEGQVINSGIPVLKLLEDTQPEARIGVAGASIEKISPADEVQVSIGGRNILATVRSVLPLRRPGTRSIEVILSLATDLKRIRSGDLVRMQIDHWVPQPGYWVPLTALTASSRGLWAVYVVEGIHDDYGLLKRRELELIYQQSDRAFVRGGLRKGETVVSAGLHRLVPDQTVHIAERKLAQL